MSVLGAFVLPHPPIIITEVGRGREKEIERTAMACEQVGREIAHLAPDTVVVISPHSILYADYFQLSSGAGARGDLRAFGAGSVAIAKKYDADFEQALSREAGGAGIPAGTLGKFEKALDHGVLIPLYFIEQHFTDYSLVRVSISGLDALMHYRLGECIASVAENLNRRIVILASGDLSHRLKADGPYGFAEEGPEFDRQVTQALGKGDFMQLVNIDSALADAAGECGLRAFFVMAGTLDGLAVTPNLLSYEGPFGVGYAVCTYAPTGKDESRRFGNRIKRTQEETQAQVQRSEDEYVRLARLALESYVKHESLPQRPEELSPELTNTRSGVFVSLKKDGRLRGCIGTFVPTRACIADEIMQNAISAGGHDPRFSPVTLSELGSLRYSVDVLGPAEPISSMEQLDPKRYGVIVSRNGRRGLLLPDLEGVDTVEEQVSIALQKAGISPNAAYNLERFEVVRHK